MWPRLVKDMHGMKVRTRIPMRNGWVLIPAGSVVTISGGFSRNRLDITGTPCAHCGIKVYISRVHMDDLEPLEFDL